MNLCILYMLDESFDIMAEQGNARRFYVFLNIILKLVTLSPRTCIESHC